MKISKVRIENFRSIKNIEVTFDPTCRVLVGINESGKSNILNALALLSPDRNPVKKDDLREPLPDENSIENSYIRFVFKFDKNELDELHKMVSSSILSSQKNPEIIKKGSKSLRLKEFCDSRDEGLYTVDILEEKKSYKYWGIINSYDLISGWKKPTSACPKEFELEIQGKKIILADFKLIEGNLSADVPPEYLVDADIQDLSTIIGNVISSITEKNLPDTLFWKYQEVNLMPNFVNIDEFVANPDICIPLKNMFTLAGYTDIKASVTEAKKGTNNHIQNFLNRIAKQTTTHFKEVWKEYRDVEFNLRLDSEQIIPGVKEKNSYDFEKRSDGFKRFVTFLLMISVQVKTDNLNNTLLLIDEPDASLHPSGARYLRDELIRISKKNYVIYSTHSIFMIDSGDLNRHYIVKKKNEITDIETAQESNIAEEEVLYNALGYSVFENLNQKNIIFEGWNDKKLFQIGLEKAPADLKAKYKEAGICHGKGVKSIKTFTPLMELANRECIILSDSDTPAKEKQKQYIEEKGYGEWKVYQDVVPSLEAVTGEDFLKNDFIAKEVRKVLRSIPLTGFDPTILPASKDKLDAIRKWLIQQGLTPEQANHNLTTIKNSLFENLKSQNIEDTYILLLEKLAGQYFQTN